MAAPAEEIVDAEGGDGEVEEFHVDDSKLKLPQVKFTEVVVKSHEEEEEAIYTA